MKIAPIITNLTSRLRDRNAVLAASLVASWKGGVAFLGAAAVALLYQGSPIIGYSKLGFVLIALAGWLIDAYFKRAHWRIEQHASSRAGSPR